MSNALNARYRYRQERQGLTLLLGLLACIAACRGVTSPVDEAPAVPSTATDLELSNAPARLTASKPLRNPFKSPAEDTSPAVELRLEDLAPADTLLAEPRQQEIWDAEHVTHMLEWRFGKTLRAALFKSPPAAIENHFQESMQGVTLDLASGKERRLASLHELYGDRTFAKTAPCNAGQLAAWLKNLASKFREFDSTSFRVLFIDRADDSPNHWRARVLLSCRGSSLDGTPLELLSEHTVGFQWRDDQELYRDAVVASWVAENLSL